MCSDEEFKCYIPLLVHYGCKNLEEVIYKNDTLIDFIINKCVTNYDLLTTLYWELCIYKQHKNYLLEKLVKCIKKIYKNTDILSKIEKSRRYFEDIEKMIDEINSQKEYVIGKNTEEQKSINKTKLKELKKRKLDEPITNPLHVNQEIVKLVDFNEKQSKSRPIKLEFLTKKVKMIDIMHKTEDVRIDQIIMNVIKLMGYILSKELGIDLNLVTYNILSLDKDKGIIEMVKNAKTIYEISYRGRKETISNYILRKNSKKTVNTVRKQYLTSMAISCVISYVLGLGDRHLDNIMITNDGRMFHIDFGYLFGREPNPLLPNNKIKITTDMIDTIGGITDKNYRRFTQLVSAIYNCLRKNMNIFLNMLLLLPELTNCQLSRQIIMEEIIQKFLPGEADITRHFSIIEELKPQSYTDHIKDLSHRVNKESMSSVKSNVQYALSTIYSITTRNVAQYFSSSSSTNSND